MIQVHWGTHLTGERTNKLSARDETDKLPAAICILGSGCFHIIFTVKLKIHGLPLFAPEEPGTSNPTPWHHDQPYYCVDGKQVVSFWIPLDTVPQATCPEFVSGSHAWGKWFLPRKFSGVDYNHTEEWLEPIPDIENQREDYDIRSWDLEPGDAIAFHFLTVHGAPPNKSKKLRRRGFAARWLGDDTTYAQRSGDMSPPFPGLEKRLNVGDPLDADEFPQVWPRT